jgi:hypothetical protein
MQRAEKIESSDSYLIQALLSQFLSGAIKTLEPTFDRETGYHYPAAETIIGDANKVNLLLSKLTQEKILEAKLYDKIIYCPKCGSVAISFRYCCPFCKSFNIKKSSLIEHVRCGYMDLEDNFRKTGTLTCPKCHEEMHKLDADYRKAGIWCACNDCGKSFDIPVPEHYCTICHAVSNFEQAVIRDVYSFTLSASAKEKMSSNITLVTPIRELLVKQGYKVETPAELAGKSGAKHSFNLAAFTHGRVIVVDFAMSAEGLVSEQPVIALFAKIFDVSPSKAFLVAIPRLGDNARKMAELYNIYVIDATNQAEVVLALQKKLN